MEYNTQKKKLLLPEYGRNIQKMVDYLLTIEDREERTRAAKTVIDVMGNLYPHLRDVPDFRHKLWDHLAIMSEFKLDIDTPYPLPSLSKLQEKPERLPYSSNHIKYKHYGKLVEKLIDKMNSEISKAILGQTPTTEIGSTGSYAAANTHMAVRQDIIDSDKKLVESVINQLIRWIYEINF